MQNQTDLIYFTSAFENIKQLYCILQVTIQSMITWDWSQSLHF